MRTYSCVNGHKLWLLHTFKHRIIFSEQNYLQQVVLSLASKRYVPLWVSFNSFYHEGRGFPIFCWMAPKEKNEDLDAMEHSVTASDSLQTQDPPGGM